MDLIRSFWFHISTTDGLREMIAWGGIPVMTAIVFAETGLLIGFFLPGDSLLFIGGFMASPAAERLFGSRPFSILTLNAILMIAAIAGDTVGYWIGNRAGPAIFNRPQSRFFRRDYLLAAHAFYEKHGGKTIIMARFIPIVRTFAPVVAGAADMNYRKFLSYNIFGGIGWVFSMTMMGYKLGEIAWIQKNLEKAVILVILLSISPMFIHWMGHRRKQRQAARGAVNAPPEKSVV
jgi:membrane-associated protein